MSAVIFTGTSGKIRHWRPASGIQQPTRPFENARFKGNSNDGRPFFFGGITNALNKIGRTKSWNRFCNVAAPTKRSVQMGQGANSGRNASLDEKKDRSAGRRNERGRDEIRDAKDPVPAKGKTGGAKGKDEQVNKAGLIDRSNATQRVVDTGSSTKRARKR